MEEKQLKEMIRLCKVLGETDWPAMVAAVKLSQEALADFMEEFERVHAEVPHELSLKLATLFSRNSTAASSVGRLFQRLTPQE